MFVVKRSSFLRREKVLQRCVQNEARQRRVEQVSNDLNLSFFVTDARDK